MIDLDNQLISEFKIYFKWIVQWICATQIYNRRKYDFEKIQNRKTFEL